MQNTPLAKELFRKCKGKINRIFKLMAEYEEMRNVLDEMGYRIPFGDDGEWDVTLPVLSLSGNIGGETVIDSADMLDEYLEHGPMPPIEEARGRKRAASRRARDRVGKESGWTCRYCRQRGDEAVGPDGRAWHVDHSYPVSRGGDNGADNLVLACATCNLQKHALSALEHEARLQ